MTVFSAILTVLGAFAVSAASGAEPSRIHEHSPRGLTDGSAQARRPNVIIILPDQLRWSALACYGNPVVSSPNIDRLAVTGIRFTHGFTNFPSCSPARSTLLSGRYARSNGVSSNQDPECVAGRPTNREPTLAEALSAHGYHTALVGKWHLAPNPQVLGFQHSLRSRYPLGLFKQEFRRNEGNPYYRVGYGPRLETDEAIKFIRKNRHRPFLLHFSPSPPHMPLADLPEEYQKQYDPAKIPLRPNVWKNGKLAYDENWFKIYLWEHRYKQDPERYEGKLPEGISLRDLTALYYGQITAIDGCIGRLLAALKEEGLDDDSIVVLTSDHGDMLGSHHAFNKNRHFDEAIRIPMILRYPGRLQPRVIDHQIASLVNVMPTLLELCGLAVPESVQGVSLLPVLVGEQRTVGENAAFIETTSRDGIRTRRYLYALDRKTGDKEQLFDLVDDPHELRNLAGSKAHDNVRKSLKGRLEAWRKRTPRIPPAGS